MDLLAKFNAVEIQIDGRITETDRDYCTAHQKAYDAARTCFGELVYIWEDLTTVQADILTHVEEDSYGRNIYFSSHDDLEISSSKINSHIMSLHSRFTNRLVQHFNEKYKVSVDASVIDSHLIPERPSRDWRHSEEKEQSYQEKMLALSLRYQDILNEIFVQLDGRDFKEQALFEIKEACHEAAWSSYDKKAKYEIKKDVLRFSSYGCSYDSGIRMERWKLRDGLQQVLRGIAHYETGVFSSVPSDFSNLLGYNHSNTDLVIFSSCTKVRQVKMFKNGRVDIKFSSAESVRTFAAEYLGLVY
ncbi:hypothetical protein DS742_17450 [Lacrimispora amygdalina]|uniref:Uncharacterized protein n=1 Tax=Lacrimispora amygdalina TaxID=253257 RepID=A0A3E2N9N4_9FIRM|nr:hypothetical protein [Clostridium indicum]RFZ77601.1 hypothetical protein DS742_17450 [Clostridium indicum]